MVARVGFERQMSRKNQRLRECNWKTNKTSLGGAE